MENPNYKKQVGLLLSVLPEVAKEKSLALHGGTAINLFVRNMPRLSVDIDLTYIPIEDRAASLTNINTTLERIMVNVRSVIKDVRVDHKPEIGKLLVSHSGAGIKLEVNLVGRGVLSDAAVMPLCTKAQEEFDAFCAIQVVPFGQLFGGKICAALDRQHPRDLFDIKYLLENEGFSKQVKTGFIYCLVASNRPMHEIIKPNLQDQHLAMENQFTGISREAFNYDEYENIRVRLIEKIQAGLTDKDKEFLLSIAGLKPEWDIYDFERFPAARWKLQNLQALKDKNPEKYQEQYQLLADILSSFDRI